MIANRTKNTILCKNVEIAKSFFKKMRGLMFRKSLKSGHGLLMVFSRESREGIWTFGMRFPIDVLWISPDNRVVDMHENFKPWRPPVYPRKKSVKVLELNSGVIKKTKTSIGDILKITE